jgi:hypothetical protein
LTVQKQMSVTKNQLFCAGVNGGEVSTLGFLTDFNMYQIQI